MLNPVLKVGNFYNLILKNEVVFFLSSNSVNPLPHPTPAQRVEEGWESNSSETGPVQGGIPNGRADQRG